MRAVWPLAVSRSCLLFCARSRFASAKQEAEQARQQGGLRTRLCVAPGVLVRFFRELQEDVFQGPIQGSLFAERFQGAAADQPAVLYDADAVSKLFNDVQRMR